MDQASPAPKRSRWAALGPGLLFAGAAVGVSHLVQSTRGGAEFGLSATLVVVVCCLVKWPAFRFGPLYAAATGNSLLDGYRRRGRWTLVVFGLLTLAICFTTLAAVSMVSVGLLFSLLPDLGAFIGGLGLSGGPGASVAWGSIGLLTVIGVLLASGGYRMLERVMKFVMPVLAGCTILATLVALPQLFAGEWSLLPTIDEASDQGLLAALVGWMPAPIDIAVWSSLWTLAKIRMNRARSGAGPILADFDIGYVGTMMLAVCFVVLGAAVMHGAGVEFAASAPEFGAQVVGLYAEQLGDWAFPVVGIAAFLAMLSTTVTVADGFPRAIAALLAAAFGPQRPTRRERNPGVVPSIIRQALESSGTTTSADPQATVEATIPRGSEGGRFAYWVSFLVLGAGAGVILFRVDSGDFRRLIDFVTISSFLIAPVLVLFNHWCVTGAEMPESLRPNLLWRAWSWLCFGVTGGFAVWYLLDRFVLVQAVATG